MLWLRQVTGQCVSQAQPPRRLCAHTPCVHACVCVCVCVCVRVCVCVCACHRGKEVRAGSLGKRAVQGLYHSGLVSFRVRGNATCHITVAVPTCASCNQVPVMPTHHACVPTLSESFVMNRTSGDPFERLMYVTTHRARAATPMCIYLCLLYRVRRVSRRYDVFVTVDKSRSVEVRCCIEGECWPRGVMTDVCMCHTASGRGTVAGCLR